MYVLLVPDRKHRIERLSQQQKICKNVSRKSLLLTSQNVMNVTNRKTRYINDEPIKNKTDYV